MVLLAITTLWLWNSFHKETQEFHSVLRFMKPVNFIPKSKWQFILNKRTHSLAVPYFFPWVPCLVSPQLCSLHSPPPPHCFSLASVCTASPQCLHFFILPPPLVHVLLLFLVHASTLVLFPPLPTFPTWTFAAKLLPSWQGEGKRLNRRQNWRKLQPQFLMWWPIPGKLCNNPISYLNFFF